MVLQAGDGNATLFNVGTALFLKEYSPATAAQSAPVTTITIPASGAGMRLVVSGMATSGGGLSLSQDSTRLVFTGYDTSTNTAGVANSASANILRVI